MEGLILNTSFEAIEVLDTFESLIWTERYCGCGDFEIYAPVDMDLKNILKTDHYIWMKNSKCVMIVDSQQISSDVEKGNHLTITGKSLEFILDRRIIWNQTILSGSFQDGIQQLLNENIINPTIENRKINNFRFIPSTDPIITALTISAQYKGENLYTTIVALCTERKIGFRITLSNDNYFEFQLYSGVDRSYGQEINPYVVFSPKFENLFNSNYVESKKALKTVTLVEGIDSKTVSVDLSTNNSGLARREMYTDATDLSNTKDGETMTDEVYLSQLTQRGTKDLSENVFISSFEGQAETTQLFKYGDDFFIGDIVQLVSEYGIESKSRITELVTSQNTSGISVYPTFATVT